MRATYLEASTFYSQSFNAPGSLLLSFSSSVGLPLTLFCLLWTFGDEESSSVAIVTGIESPDKRWFTPRCDPFAFGWPLDGDLTAMVVGATARGGS